MRNVLRMITRLTAVVALVFVMTMPSGLSAQYGEGKVDIFVFTPSNPILSGLSEFFTEQLTQLGFIEARVIHPPSSDVLMSAIDGSFINVDGSQLALVSVDPMVFTTHLAEFVEPVALLGRLDLALYVDEDSSIFNLEDFRNQNNQVRSVGVHSPMSKWSTTKLFADLSIPINASYSYEIGAQIEKTSRGILDAMVAPLGITGRGLRPIAVFSDHGVDAARTARDQGVDVTASYDYLVVAPNGLEQSAYDAINRDIGAMLEPASEFARTVLELGLRPQYVEGADYRGLVANQFSELFKLQNTFCDTCDCSESDCKRDCPRCDN